MELYNDQRLYLQSIFDFFHDNGKWPTYSQIERKLIRIRRDLDIEKIAKSLPSGFANTFAFSLNLGDEAILSVRAIHLCAGSKEDLAAFIRVIGFCVERYFNAEEETIEISSDELNRLLNMEELSLRKVGLLIKNDYEYPIYRSFGYKDSEGKILWTCTLSRNVRQFDGVDTIEQYLEKLNQLKSPSTVTVPEFIKSEDDKKVFVGRDQHNIVSIDENVDIKPLSNGATDELPLPTQHYPYDVALSYAGEDREKAEALVAALQRRGVKVFYDQDEKSTIWGKNLYTYLSDLYKNKARYCLMLLSYHYATKRWTKHELKSAQARAFIDEHEDYILPVRIDNTEIPGILETTAFLNWHTETAETIADAILAKLDKLPPSSEEILNTISTMTTNTVLILGRFTAERKAVLDAIRDELRLYKYAPILIDFEKPNNRNYTEMARTLAHLSRFIIADITDPSSIPQELQAIVPVLAVPVQPILLEGEKKYAMFLDFEKYHWVLPVFLYKDLPSLLASLKEHVINPAEEKARELEKRQFE